MRGNRKRSRVLLLKAGEVSAPVRLSHGDYDRWFAEALQAASLDWIVVEMHAGGALPEDASVFDAMVITGSPLSLTEPEPWMRRAGDYLREAAEKKMPVLGVCFGHQLLGYAYGSEVVRNPRGREIGSVELRLTEDGERDPLFAGVPQTLTVQATHEDIVAKAPPGSTILAGNANTANQAIAIGPNVRGVQFHPELRHDALAALVRSRAATLEDEAVRRGAPAAQAVPVILNGIRPAPLARTLLLNFIERFV
jgi:GMP synthase (glutamine-hydrolysing)